MKKFFFIFMLFTSVILAQNVGDLASRLSVLQNQALTGWRVNNGTATVPTYSFANSTGLGFYRNGSNVLGFVTAGSDRAFLDASGRFTVGSTTQTTSIFGVRNSTNQANIAIFSNVSGTTRATLDSAGTFTPIKYGAATLAGSFTASDSTTSIIIKDSGGKKWKLRVYTNGGVVADSVGLN